MKMKDFVIVGTGDFANQLVDMIENDLHRNIAGYVVDKKYKTTDIYRGKKVFEFEEILEAFPPEQYSVALGFLGGNMYQARFDKYLLLKEMGYELENIIHSSAQISKSCKLGECNYIFNMVALQNDTEIGSCNVFSGKAYVAHNGKVGNANFFGTNCTTTGYVEIKNNCFIGANSAINNKVIVDDYTFIGGGFFITNNTNRYDVFVPSHSIPLKRIRSIDFQMFSSRRTSND